MIGSVQEVCKQKGLSLLELADKSGLDIPKVRAIFLGRWTPSPKERDELLAHPQILPCRGYRTALITQTKADAAIAGVHANTRANSPRSPGHLDEPVSPRVR